MALRIRAHDWASTSLGPITSWPQSLKTIVDLMLDSPSMMSLVWGLEAIHIYNDAFTDLLQEQRTLALGRSAFETFACSREVFEADVSAGMAGRSDRLHGQCFLVLRHGRLEDAWFDVDFVPIRDEAGAVAGVLWTLRETTAHHLAEKALHATETRHRFLVESWAQAEWETDAAGVVIVDSPSWRAYTGQTLKEWLGYGWLDAIHPNDRVYAERQWREAIAARAPVDAEFRLRAPDGGWRWTNVRAAPVLDANGSIEKWAGMNIDIGARKGAEAALLESEARFQQFSEATPDILWGRDAKTLQWDYLSPAFEEIYGLSREEALKGNDLRRWLERIEPEDRHEAINSMRRVRDGDRVTFECRIRRPDGQVRWLSNTDFPIRDQSGHVHRIGGIGQDVTELKAIEAALTQSEYRLRTLVEGVPLLVWRAIDQGDWTWASPQWVAFTGQPEPESHHLGWLEPIHPDDREMARAAWDRAAQAGGFEIEYRIRNAAQDAYRWFQTRATPVRDATGKIVEWLGTSTDIHDLRAMQERQKVLVSELQHRTRNLMGVVRATAENTLRASTDLADFGERYRDRLNALARVQGLLSRLKGVERITFDELIQSELDAIGAINGSLGKVVLNGPARVALRSSTVQTFALALHELATNAVKYGALTSPTGHLAVTWRLEHAQPDDVPWLHVDWHESGVAMPPTDAAPRGTGQGRQLIERALPYQLGARTIYILGLDGVRCSIAVPVSSRTALEAIDDDHESPS